MAGADDKAPADAAGSATLDTLFATVKSRIGANPETSYTAKLLGRGIDKCAQKLGEEAVETVIAAVQKDRVNVISESADLLYHWLVILAALDIEPNEVYAEIVRRQGLSGLEQKEARRGGQ